MSLQDLINVQISATGNLPAQAGFGVPLIAAYHTKYPDLVRYYSNLSGLVLDGFSTTGEVYLAASAILNQSPNVTQFAVGRRTSLDVQALQLTFTSTSSLDTYKCTFVDSFGKSYAFSMASTGTPSADATSAATAISALGIAGHTAAASGSHVTLTAAAGFGLVTHVGSGPTATNVTFSGTPSADDLFLITITLGGIVGTATFSWSKNGGAATTGVVTSSSPISLADGVSVAFTAGTYVLNDTYTVQAARANHTCDVQGWDQSQLITPILQIADLTPDPGLTADLAAILAADTNWYGLCLGNNSPAHVKSAMAWVESNKKLGAFNCSDTAIELATPGNVALATQALGYSRSAGIYSRSAIKCYAGAAALGMALPPAPGSITWAYKNLVGVPSDFLSQSVQNNVLAASWNYFTTFKGSRVLIPGVSPAGEYLDIVQGVDWFTDLLTTDLFALFVGNKKVPFTDKGGDQVLAVIKADLQKAIEADFADPGDDTTPAPQAFVPKVSSISASNRAKRIFAGSTFSFKLAGAIQNLTLTGTVTP